ncbi:MAG: coproporphyrinogen dehydrogenase HemZ, partial [Oscillospiraceae bacterium]
PEEVGEMLNYANKALSAAKYEPYYLYRQKYMSGGFENIGWQRGNTENVYNICIMEELCSIIALGGGASTKLSSGNGKIERIYDPKYPNEYIEGIDKIVAEKEKIKEFLKWHII